MPAKSKKSKKKATKKSVKKTAKRSAKKTVKRSAKKSTKKKAGKRTVKKTLRKPVKRAAKKAKKPAKKKTAKRAAKRPAKKAAAVPAPRPAAPAFGSSMPMGMPPAAIGAPKRVKAEHTVAVGDSLRLIALKYYGPGGQENWKVIYDANKAVIGENPYILKPGQVLKIPEL
jgi:nucleoid-associated protein YgaU